MMKKESYDLDLDDWYTYNKILLILSNCPSWEWIALDKALFSAKKYLYFSYFPTKHMLWYSLEAPRWGASNEYPQHMFLSGNKKTINLIPTLI